MLRGKCAARLAFTALETEARIGWRLGQVPDFDPRSAVGPFTTLVSFLPAGCATELAQSISRFPGLGSHFVYPSAQLHVTVCNLDRSDLSELPTLLARNPPIRLASIGLGFTRGTLLLRLAAVDSSLRRVRTRLKELRDMRARGLMADVAFANVLRLNGPVAPELRESVRECRRAFAGQEFEFRELTLIRTDKVGSPDRTQVLARYFLRR